MPDTREEWLMEAVERFRPEFVKLEKPLPENVRVSVGYNKGARGAQIGWCYSSSSAKDSVNQIFISPELHEPVKVLATLLHELVHAADDCKSGHAGEFRRVATGLGLTGKMTATVPSEALADTLLNMATVMGPYTHGALMPITETGRGGPKQTTRMLKVVCRWDDTFKIRMTRKMIDSYGLPMCPCHYEQMEEA